MTKKTVNNPDFDIELFCTDNEMTVLWKTKTQSDNVGKALDSFVAGFDIGVTAVCDSRPFYLIVQIGLLGLSHASRPQTHTRQTSLGGFWGEIIHPKCVCPTQHSHPHTHNCVIASSVSVAISFAANILTSLDPCRYITRRRRRRRGDKNESWSPLLIQDCHCQLWACCASPDREITALDAFLHCDRYNLCSLNVLSTFSDSLIAPPVAARPCLVA